MKHYVIKQIDSLNVNDDWKWITTYHRGEFFARGKDHKRAFLYSLHKLGIICKRGKMAVIQRGKSYVVQDRRTGKPLFAAIPIE